MIAFIWSSVIGQTGTVSQSLRSELVDLHYKASRDPVDEDILVWWKNNEMNFSTIVRFDRNVLSTHAPFVCAERLFSWIKYESFESKFFKRILQ